MSAKSKYYISPKIVDVSNIFQRGKTQVPKNVRERLGLNDGDKLVWYEESSKIYVKRLE